LPPRRRPPQDGPGSSRHGAEGAAWRRIAAFVANRDRGICHICGHPGAGVPDHLVPVTERPDLALKAENMKAAHGYRRSAPGFGACPVCTAAAEKRGGKPVYCNELRGMGSVERARKIIESRTGLALGVTPEDKPRGERDWLLLLSGALALRAGARVAPPVVHGVRPGR
jgi:hypothetical protein